MKNSLLIFLVSFAFTLSAQDTARINWVKDIRYLKKQLPLLHVNLFSQKSYTEFKKELDDLSDHLPGLSDLAITIKLQQIISSFGDSHTGIDTRKFMDKEKALPVYFTWFKDGIFITSASSANKNILGKKLLAINNYSLQPIIDSLSTILTVDNKGVLKKSVPYLFTRMQLLEYFGFAKDENYNLDLYDPQTGDTTRNILVTLEDRNEIIDLAIDSTPPSLKFPNPYFSHQYFASDKIYLVQYRMCWSKELEIKYNHGKHADTIPSFEVFKREILSDLKNLEIDKLVFDVRYNSGGSSLQGTLLIDELYEMKKIKKEMQVYVLIGRHTYSSAIINALDFEKFENVKYVGDETSGRPNHYGEVRQFKLPESGLMVNYSTKYFHMTDKHSNTIKPDVYILRSMNDFVHGIDPVFEWIRQQ